MNLCAPQASRLLANWASRPGHATKRICVPLRLRRHYKELFEEELYGWYTDAKLWPRDRSLKLLMEWCAMELNAVVVDFGDSPIEEED